MLSEAANANMEEIKWKLGSVEKEKRETLEKIFRLHKKYNDLDAQEKHLRRLYYEKKDVQKNRELDRKPQEERVWE